MNIGWIYLTIAITSEVIGSMGLKASQGFSKMLPSIIMGVGYISAFYFLSLTLKTLPLSLAYAVWAGLGTALIAILGVLFFKEQLSITAWMGLALIIVGVVLLNLSGVKH